MAARHHFGAARLAPPDARAPSMLTQALKVWQGDNTVFLPQHTMPRQPSDDGGRHPVRRRRRARALTIDEENRVSEFTRRALDFSRRHRAALTIGLLMFAFLMSRGWQQEEDIQTLTPAPEVAASARPPDGAEGTQTLTPVADTPCTPTNLSPAAVELVRLYEELHTFKDDLEFLDMGFSRTGPYYAWMEAVEAHQDANPGWVLFDELGFAANEVLMLGINYMDEDPDASDLSAIEFFETKFKLA